MHKSQNVDKIYIKRTGLCCFPLKNCTQLYRISLRIFINHISLKNYAKMCSKTLHINVKFFKLSMKNI